MVYPFIEAMDAEIEALEATLSKNPQYVKLKELHRLRHLWTPASDVRREQPRASRSLRSGGGRRSSPQRQRIIDEAASIIRATFSATPVPTVSLLNILLTNGVAVPGKDQRNSLSAILSGAKHRFQSHGRAGWTLKPESTETADHAPGKDEPAESAERRLTSDGYE
jgi:hypothetical protein